MASETLTLKVITPSGLALEERVDDVVIKGDLGEFGVLPGHVSMISGVVAGRIRFTNSGGVKTFIVHSGMAEVRDDTVTVLTELLESPDDVDVSAASKEAEELNHRLESGGLSEEDRKLLSRRLLLARARAGIS